jgi:Rod binding domain-containing protein
MKLDPLGMTTAPVGGSREVDATGDKPLAGAVKGPAPIDPEKLRLAREFEEIFIRKMLASLEKSGHSTGGASASSGSDAYSSMVVSAMAQAVSQGGGVGLAEVIARSATEQAAIQDAAKAHASGNPASTPQLATPWASTLLPGTSTHATAPAALAGPTYARPAPPRIDKENEDIQLLLKDRKP